jgi:hypothetical protein
MGQYYKIVNVKKREYLNPHMFGDGLKLMEFALSGGGTLSALAVLLSDGNGHGGGDLKSDNPIVGSWAGDPIVVAGDYADTGRFLPADKSDINLYMAADNEGKDISHLILDALMEDKWFAEDFIKNWRHDNPNDAYYGEVNKVVNKWKRVYNIEAANPHLSTQSGAEHDVIGSTGNVYKITEPDDPNGVWTCSCPAYTYHKVPGTECKHIKDIRTKMGI